MTCDANGRTPCQRPATCIAERENGAVIARCTRHAPAYILDGGATAGIIEVVWLGPIPRSVKVRQDAAPIVRLSFSTQSCSNAAQLARLATLRHRS